MSNADDVKRLIWLPRFPGCEDLLQEPAPVAFTTERRFEQRALNFVLGHDPHLTSRANHGPENLHSKQPLRRSLLKARFVPPPTSQVCQEISSILPRTRRMRSPAPGREQPFCREVFRAFAWFSRAADDFRNRSCHNKNRSEAPESAISEQKRRRAAPGEDESTDVLRTGVPKPPPAFPRSKKFSQAALRHGIIAYFVPTPESSKHRRVRWLRKILEWRSPAPNPNLNRNLNLLRARGDQGGLGRRLRLNFSESHES